MRAEIFEVHVERAGKLAGELLADRCRDGDPAGLGQRLDSRRHVDAVAEHVVAIDDDVTEIEADAKD